MVSVCALSSHELFRGEADHLSQKISDSVLLYKLSQANHGLGNQAFLRFDVMSSLQPHGNHSDDHRVIDTGLQHLEVVAGAINGALRGYTSSWDVTE